MKEYGLYDVKDNEQCVRIGTLKEIADYLNTSTNSLYSYITHRQKGERSGLLRKRYDLVEITEEGEEIHIKSNREKFEEILKAFGWIQPKGLQEIIKEIEYYKNAYENRVEEFIKLNKEE